MIFNEEQKTAINHKQGPALILAGPGSGKTAVITERTFELVNVHGINPKEILVITFTKAAAEEMKERYLKKLGFLDDGVTFGTFHAVFFMILRESKGLGRDALLTGAKQYEILDKILEKTGGRTLSSEDRKRILGEISRRKSGAAAAKTEKTSLQSEKTLQQSQKALPQSEAGSSQTGPALPCSLAEFERIYVEYAYYLKSEHKLDFEDILIKCLEVLRTDGKVRAKWQNRFKYILVDEFQDINSIQYETVKLLAAPLNNLFAVGDDDQSIYSFRGANHRMVDCFMEDFPGCRTVILSRNYRSAPCITKTAGNLIRHNLSHKNKKITGNAGKKGKVEIKEYEERFEEYRAIAAAILDAPNDFETTAILYRTNTQARAISRVLTEKGVPFEMQDGPQNLINNPIAGDLLAYLRLSEGCGTRQDMLRICNKPYRGIRREMFTDTKALDRLAGRELINEALDKTEALQKDLESLNGLTPFGAVMLLRKALGYEQYLVKQGEGNEAGAEENLEILEEMTEYARLSRNTAEFEKMLSKQENSEHFADRTHKPGVKLMTYHASKGLEFKTVYMPDMNEGVVPLKQAKSPEAIEEERRMVYVALTRAEENLFLSYTKKRGGRLVQPSRFMSEMNNSLQFGN